MTKCILSLAVSCSLLVACQSHKPALDNLTAQDEPYRPAYHHAPQQNWMNDPNGMFYDAEKGLWHLYFQYNPQAPVWGNMTWGHSVSNDLIHWTQQSDAILPDEQGMIFSGSCVIDTDNTAGFGAGAIVAMYTAASDAQRQAIAYSTDGGQSFIKYEGNPVLTADIRDFRDPKMWRDADGWKVVLAAGQELRFYRSDNLKEWTYLSSFGTGYGCHDGVWECPDMIRCGEKDVLIVNINPGGIHGGSATQYFVGNWDGTAFTIDPTQDTQTYWMDYGKDHYATVSFYNAPNNRHVVLAWMSNWQYAEVVPSVAFRSQNSLARDIRLRQLTDGTYRLMVVPSPENDKLDIPTYEYTYSGKPVHASIDGDEMVERVHIRFSDMTKPVQVVLSNDAGEKVVMDIDPAQQVFRMDRRESGKVDFHPDFAAFTSAPLPDGEQVDLVLYLDRSSIEVFLNDGWAVMSNLLFPTQPYNHVYIQ